MRLSKLCSIHYACFQPFLSLGPQKEHTTLERGFNKAAEAQPKKIVSTVQAASFRLLKQTFC